MRPNLKRRQEIIDLRNQGMTRPEIAAHLGISEDLVGGYIHQLIREGTVKAFSKQEELARRRTAAKKVDVDAARQMRLAGKSYNEIAEYYRVSSTSIQNLIGRTPRITPIQRQLIDLRSQGLTYEEIAAQLGKPEGTVAVMIGRLIKKALIPSSKK